MMDVNCFVVYKMLRKMFNKHKPLVNEVIGINAQGG